MRRVVERGKIFPKKILAESKSLLYSDLQYFWLFFRNELVCEEQMELVALDEAGKIMPKAVALSTCCLF
jgi:hypothetical protein